MKRLVFLLVSAILLLGLSVPLAAQGPHPTVICNGNICGGAGPRNYYYDVSVWPDELFTSFGIGVHDPVLANYANMVMPANWAVGIFGEPGWQQLDDPFTPHGQVSGNSGQCPYTLFWWTGSGGGQAVQQAFFGFDYNADPHDTGWVCSGVKENWAMPVGTGQGPVHSPVPEPASLLALGSGLLALAGIRRRK